MRGLEASPHLTAGKTEVTAGPWDFPSDPGRLDQACPEPWGARGVHSASSRAGPSSPVFPSGDLPRQRSGETVVASEAVGSAQSRDTFCLCSVNIFTRTFISKQRD